jgi:IS1 family transposase/transposase-like protein
MNCPKCNSANIVKNGSIHNKKQKFKCKECNKQFVENPARPRIDDKTKQLIDRLLLERLSLLGISRVTGVSVKSIMKYIKHKYANIERKVKVLPKQKGKLTVQIDELWSFVGNKGNKTWVWIAIDVQTREVIGLYIGDRSRDSAKRLWNTLPPVYRQCAVFYTDYWEAYVGVIPHNRHRRVGKESGKTSYIERLNCTFRQRISRLVRKSLSFSKSLENHIGAIWNFVHDYNANLSVT